MIKNTSLEILAVRRSEPRVTELLFGFAIDEPQVGDRIISAEVQFKGWVLGKMSPAIALEVVLNNNVLQTLPVNHARPDVVQVYPQVPEAGISGFLATVDLSNLPEEGILELYGLLRDQSYICLASLPFRHTVNSLNLSHQPLDSTTNVDDEQRALKLKRIEADLDRSQTLLQQARAKLAKSSEV